MTSLKLITFDLDNTLWPVAKVIERAEQASIRYLHQRFPEHADQLTLQALAQLRQGMAQNRTHYWKNLTQLRIDMLKLALSRLDLSHHDINTAAQAAFDAFYEERNKVVFFQDVLGTLTTLKKHYTLGAISNGNSDIHKVGLGDLFAFHLCAEKVGEAKPHPLIFNTALTLAGVAPAQSLHVGDHPQEDVDGARKAGMKTIWANQLDEHWPAELEKPQFEMTQFHQLTDLIGQCDDA